MATRRDAANNGSRGPTPQPPSKANTNSNSNTSGSNRSGSTGGKRPNNTSKSKGVAWADDKTAAKQQRQQVQDQLTFYREGTPPPLDDDGYQQSSLSTGPHAAGTYTYDYSYDHVAPPAPIPQVTICGVRKRVFWIAVGVAILVVVIALGVGIGVGVGSKHSSTSNGDNATNSLSSASIHTVTPTSIAVEPTQTALLACPAANNTKYEVKSVKKTFLRVCGVDYVGSGGAVDLGVVWTASMQDCMNSCAGYTNCTGCSWGVIPGDGGSDHRCWLKSDLKSPTSVRSGWDFAILE